MEALRKIRDSGVSRSELQRAKDFYRGQFAIGLESSDDIASFFGNQELFRNKIVLPDEVMDRIEKVSEEDVLNAAKEIFKSQNMNAALIGPHREDMEIAPLLAL